MSGFTQLLNFPLDSKSPLRDEAYKRFIRSWPCVGCGRRWGIDACHTGPRGISTKAGDDTCIPLCHKACHREYDRNPREFARKRHLDIAALREYFRKTYTLSKGEK